MGASKISSILRNVVAYANGYEGLTIVDYAFMIMRAIVITGCFFWIILHPYDDMVKLWLITLFSFFVIYSIVIHWLILTWPRKVESIYLACLTLDLIFAGIFIKISGGFNSITFLVIYPLVALHSFYYGFLRGIALSIVVSIVYILAIHEHWMVLQWTDLVFRLSMVFLIAGFLGFISEKERHDRKEMINTQLQLNSLQSEREKSFKNLQDIKAQVEQSEKLASLGRLSAELAHEINNPLDGIKNCLAVIKNDSEDHHLKKRYLALVDEAIQNIENAVRNLLDYSKRHEPKFEEIDVIGILQRTIAMAEHKLQKNGIAVETDFNTGIPFIIGDSHQLQEVFFNIILNAIDAMSDGGRLTIEANSKDRFVEINIIDTGTGIPRDNLTKIFQPFYTTKPLGEGTGLGLPVSLEIVKKHNGSLNVYSEVGVGTMFSIILPVGEKDRINTKEKKRVKNI